MNWDDRFSSEEIIKTIGSLNEEVMRAERMAILYPELEKQWKDKGQRMTHAIHLIKEGYLL